MNEILYTIKVYTRLPHYSFPKERLCLSQKMKELWCQSKTPVEIWERSLDLPLFLNTLLHLIFLCTWDLLQLHFTLVIYFYTERRTQSAGGPFAWFKQRSQCQEKASSRLCVIEPVCLTCQRVEGAESLLTNSQSGLVSHKVLREFRALLSKACSRWRFLSSHSCESALMCSTVY